MNPDTYKLIKIMTSIVLQCCAIALWRSCTASSRPKGTFKQTVEPGDVTIDRGSNPMATPLRFAAGKERIHVTKVLIAKAPMSTPSIISTKHDYTGQPAADT